MYRLLSGLGSQLPEPLRDLVTRSAEDAVAKYGDMIQAEDLRQIRPDRYASVMEDRRSNTTLGIKYFGGEVWGCFGCDDAGLAAFLEAVRDPNSEIDDDYIRGTGLTWLHYAASRGWAGAVQALLSMPGCDVNRATEDGNWTPLFMACQAGHFEVTTVLLDHQADATVRTDSGRTCFHELAAFEPARARAVAQRLVAAGLPVDVRDATRGETPLEAVCFRLGGCSASLAVIQALVELGADPSIPGGSGYSCVDIAAMQLDPDALGALLRSPFLAANNAPSVRAHALLVLISTPMVDRLRHAGSSYHSRLRAVCDALISTETMAAYPLVADGHTPLFDACSWCDIDMISLLLEAGCDTGAVGERPSPLLLSVRNNLAEVAKRLAAAEADLAAVTDANGWNILHYVAFYFPAILPFMLAQLQRRGCDMRSQVNAGCHRRGFTPFDVAVHAQNFKSADLLREHGAQHAEFTRYGENDGWLKQYHLFSSLQGCCRTTRQLDYLLALDESPRLTASNGGLTVFHLIAGETEIGMWELFPPCTPISFVWCSVRRPVGRGHDCCQS